MGVVVSPSLLSCDFVNIESELKALRAIEDIWIHLDIMDGHFVPNLTFGIPIVRRISQVTDQSLDAHLMVANPAFHIEKMTSFGIHNITFHHEAVQDSLPLIHLAKKNYPSVGISLKPETDVSQLSNEVLQNVDLVLVMSVNPGFGGQPFLTHTLSKMTSLKVRRHSLGASFIIQVDGGINRETGKQAITAGADNLVAGSYVFEGPQRDYPNRIKSLQD